MTPDYLESLDLRTNWPSPLVRRIFEFLLNEYFHLAQVRLASCVGIIGEGLAELAEPFSALCGMLVDACDSSEASSTVSGQEALPSLIRQISPEQRPQATSSVLAMLLHRDPYLSAPGDTTNDRRPRHRHSTFPNSPGLSRLLCDLVFDRLVPATLPKRCPSLEVARNFARTAFRFKILDPSMEGGQLLLGLAEAWARRVQQQFHGDNPHGLRLIRAGLERLCRDCLFGVDRNPLALIAVATVFQVYCNQLGLRPIIPRQLACNDSLRPCEESKFDAIVNNPPWGEKLDSTEREYIRSNFLHAGNPPDTYLAFVERSLHCLKRHGLYAFALPSSVIGTARALGLRELLARRTRIDLLVPLPRQVFADAAIRSIVVVGRKLNPSSRERCQVVAAQSFDSFDRPGVVKVKSLCYRRLLTHSWTSLFLTRAQRSLSRNTKCLTTVSSIRSGVSGKAFRLQRCDSGHTVRECEKIFNEHIPFGHIPAILSRNVGPMSLGRIAFFSRLDLRNETHAHAITSAGCVAVRRLVAGDGRLLASPLLFKSLPVKGVFVVDQLELNPYVLSAILGSSTVAHWLKFNSGAQVNPNFQSVTIGDLRRIPIPKIAVNCLARPENSKSVHSDAQQLCQRVIKLGRAYRRPLHEPFKRSLLAELDRLVELLYRL
jgi:hypothetical protein